MQTRVGLNLGTIEAAPDLVLGTYWYRVRIHHRIDNIAERDLVPAQPPDVSLKELVAAGQWGRISAFRVALTLERLAHANENTVYAYRSQRVLFHAYQYKPLLKFLDSPDQRLLIADEVGVGKTIEAGLILSELEARMDLERVLVICPSRLREKWRDEMGHKFDQDFQIVGRAEIEEYLESLKRNPTKPRRFRFIVSMQSIRNEEVLLPFLEAIDWLDLTIVDEAHHARNPQTLAAEMLTQICARTRAALLLTATPIHLGNQDLFTLLGSLRPGEFRDFQAFDESLRRFEDVHKASMTVRAQRPEVLAEIESLLQPLFPKNRSNPIAHKVLDDLRTAAPRDRREWVRLERRIQDLHPLANILTRTRKRDVQEKAPVRVAEIKRCQWSAAESQAYERLVGNSNHTGWHSRKLNFGQIQRARQAASCLPAALNWTNPPEVAIEETLDLINLPDEVKSDERLRSAKAAIPAPPKDSKFEKMLTILSSIAPGDKVLIFTFFLGTSQYLTDRLNQNGVKTARIAGDVPSNPRQPKKDPRGETLREFRENPDIRVLVSTEVGSEGLDFQFCHHLINYDLPWNPMVVEQRIGRIDRFGQTASEVFIYNIVVEGTVEDRILGALYGRIKIFERSLGHIETILGEEFGKLQADYVNGKLRAEEADRRVQQAANAIEQQALAQEELERAANKLFGPEDFIRDQLRQVDRLGRHLTNASLLALLEAYFREKHPDLEVWEKPSGLYHVRLTDELQRAIQDSAPLESPWEHRGSLSELMFCMEGSDSLADAGVELINARHPLVRAARKALEPLLAAPQARVARGHLTIDPGEDQDIPEGTIVMLVYAHLIEGLRERRVLEPIARSMEHPSFLSPETSERLLHLVVARAQNWLTDGHMHQLDEATWSQFRLVAIERHEMLSQAERDDAEAAYQRRTELLKAEFDRQRRSLEGALGTNVAKGQRRMVPASRGKLLKLENDFEKEQKKLDVKRQPGFRLLDPIAACLVKVTHATSRR